LETSSLTDGVGDDVVSGRVIVSSIDGNSVCENWKSDGVESKNVVGISIVLRPHRQTVVTRVSEVTVFDDGVGDSVVKVDSIGPGVSNGDPSDAQTIEGSIQPHAALGVRDVHILDGRRIYALWALFYS